ncbi:Succinyl-CoA:3-ketoacid coenzyme A transferase 1, mitochondrial [Cyphellophora attinorum]|uniref:Succinyl-CoA:3-ketoacid-coenzyme A transferase n=1 Tax=Cyphellophora attinorum TaxID=1664694 RepID=A0A0N0NML8_9EURO|nr:Succinyl-CoA:3-ketoacid coenzyme A transferase 1, mitochondrial [Phialophora attinorum]KPI40611.1 Succinyl-CoA:3-ketoacid coenzyme A transferase 1, mitochondrial [Phialophora attinorum]
MPTARVTQLPGFSATLRPSPTTSWARTSARSSAAAAAYFFPQHRTFSQQLKLENGITILSQGFGLCGVPETLLDAIRAANLRDLTVVSNNAGARDKGLAKLSETGQISKMIGSFIGTNKPLVKSFLAGKVSVELCPQGTIVERLRAAGAGIPAFFTRTGVNTHVQTGEIPARYDSNGAIIQYAPARETRVFEDDKMYLMERALHGDVAILRAWKVDRAGNCIFRSTTRNYATVMAKAAKLTIVEAEEIVEIGQFDPDQVHLPGIFVDRVVPATAEKHIEILKVDQGSASSSSSSSSNGTEQSEDERKRILIAKRAAKELKDGSYVNLGVGIPTLAPSYLPEGVNVTLHSENGILGMGPYPASAEQADPDTVNAGKETVTLYPGAAVFDTSDSFAMIRGGHIDVSILGALQVSASGDLANYMVPGKVFNGMGGAMDLVSNPDETKVVVATYHTDKNGRSKIVESCDLPLTGRGVVSTIITELCVFEVDRKGAGLTLTELSEGVSVEDVRRCTEAKFKVKEGLGTM